MHAASKIRFGFVVVLLGASTAVGQTDPTSFSGITIDDAQAELIGEWKSSTSVKPYLGQAYLHDGAAGKGANSATFTFRLPIAGEYHLLIAYTAKGNRARKVPVTITSADGKSTFYIDQSQRPQLGTGFQPVGKFTFSDTVDAIVLVETAETTQHVIVDGIRLLTPSEFATAEQDEKQLLGPKVIVNNPAKKKPKKPNPKPLEFARQPAIRKFDSLTPDQFDELLAGPNAKLQSSNDVTFLRRVTLDLVGRQPTLDEYRAFWADKSSAAHDKTIERLLASGSFGQNWGNYWSDVIAARQAEPQLTYLNYKPFRAWLADNLNTGTGWDEVVFRMITPIGTLGDSPEGTFIGFHQGERNKLAGESARIFLGLKIGCAQCHDHPFVDMPQETFHGMAAFFARTKVKLPWNDSNGIEISSVDKGEHKMPGAKSNMPPTVYQGEGLNLGLRDLDRREELAYWMVSGDNPFFARGVCQSRSSSLDGSRLLSPGG